MSDTPPQQQIVDDLGEASDQAASSSAPTVSVSSGYTLRIWPVVILLACLWGLRIVPGLLEEASFTVMMAQFMGPLICAGLIVLWWNFLSRASLKEKVLRTLGLAIIVAITTILADKTIRGFGTLIYAVPWGISAFAIALVCSIWIRSSRRTWFALLAASVGFGYWDLVRTDEIRGDFRTTQSWRWEPTAEDRFLQELSSRPREPSRAASATSNQPLAKAEWPSFRGLNRNGVQPGVVLSEDWRSHPPQEIWRIRVGPGWSSFSVAGNRLFTQEQRGENEAVVCLDADSGREVWAHQYKSRFWEVVGGAGPRATPTLHNGMLFALGAVGILRRLDPVTGESVWSRDIGQDAGREPPQWGFASSPLVTNGLVLVHAGGPQNKGLLAYDVETGELVWGSPAGDHSYSSPQLSTIAGKPSVLMLTNHGLTVVDPASGKLLGKHEWKYEGYRVVQPLVVGSSSVLLGTAMGTGTRRIELSFDGERFSTKVRWTSLRMSPYFNDYVAHNGHLYGFDNNIFACVDLATGKREWKKGRYGNGQALLLPDADQLLVLSEDGELVLLRATPKELIELAKQRVLNGRTWNHPVLIGNRVFVRNGEEATCFEVP